MILLYVFGGIVVLNCTYLILYSRFSYFTLKDDQHKDSFPVSLIICAKNEEAHLKEFIPYWLKQDHPRYEIILINDASTDNSLDIMESFGQQDSRISIVDVNNNEAFWGSKKYALTLGIKQASYQHMIFTDADCKPASKSWLKKISSHFSSEIQIVLGFGSYQKEQGWLNKIIRFETALTAIQYFSYAIVGIPYMGVGRNLGYTQKIFYDNRGFMLHMDIPSGDDDLFVNQAANRDNTTVCFNKDSFTFSNPKTSWKKWLHQKKRHISTAKHYQRKHKFLLGLFYISTFLFWILAITTLLRIDWKIPLILFLSRMILYWIIIGKAMKKLDQKDLIYFFPFLEIFLLFLQLSIFISNSISKPTKWK